MRPPDPTAGSPPAILAIMLSTLVVIAALASCSLGAAQNLVVNGSFENPVIPAGFAFTANLPGWTIVAPSVNVELWRNFSGWASSDGAQHAEFDTRVIEQVVPTMPGRGYVVSLDWAPRPGFANNAASIEWEGTTVLTVQGNGAAATQLNWTTSRAVVVAGSTGSGSLLRLVSGQTGCCGIQIDNVRVEAAPSAACVFRNGSGVNPAAYQCSSPPRLGQLWTSAIATTPATVWTGIVLGVPAAPMPAFGGEALLVPFDSRLSSTGAFSVPIPNDPGLLGQLYSAQGVRIENASNPRIVLLNAQDLRLGG